MVVYFIHLGLGCLVSISFPFSFFFLFLACDCACGFVHYINRERAAQPVRLGGFYVGLIRGLICGMLNFFLFVHCIHELSELSGYSILFLSLFSRRARGDEAFGCDPVAHLARRGLGVRSYPYPSTFGEKPAQGKGQR
jgi:hypothetical protein